MKSLIEQRYTDPYAPGSLSGLNTFKKNNSKFKGTNVKIYIN